MAECLSVIDTILNDHITSMFRLLDLFHLKTESLLTITPCSLIVLCTEGYLVGKLQHEIKA